MERTLTYQIAEDLSGLKISQFLRRQGYSLQNLTDLKKMNESVLLNGEWAYLNQRLSVGDHLLIHIQENESSEKIPPVDLPLDIVYEDEDIIVINKPAGMPIHPSRNNYTNSMANALAWYYKEQGKPFIFRCTNRLDRDTSGVMMFAKDEKTQRTLRDNWHDIVTDRRYVAVVEGSMEKDYDTVVSWLTDKTLYVSSSGYDDGGSKSITHYRTIKRANGYSLVELDLETGRKNQIRVHMQDLGHPIAGDGRYGGENYSNPIGRLALHAFKLCFYHPVTGDLMEFETPYPGEFKKLFLKK